MHCCSTCDTIRRGWAVRERRRRARRAEALRYLAIVGCVVALMVFNAVAEVLPA